MSKGSLVAVWAMLLFAASLASPARSGEWQYDPATDTVWLGSVPVAQWYAERPAMVTGQRRYYSAHSAPSCPHRLCGYPIPIYKARRPMPGPVAYRVRPSAHAKWCAARYRSYDLRTDTYQPYHGPRRECWSPYS